MLSISSGLVINSIPFLNVAQIYNMCFLYIFEVTLTFDLVCLLTLTFDLVYFSVHGGNLSGHSDLDGSSEVIYERSTGAYYQIWKKRFLRFNPLPPPTLSSSTKEGVVMCTLPNIKMLLHGGGGILFFCSLTLHSSLLESFLASINTF